MKVLIYLAVWRRPEITEICFMGIDRLRKKFPVESFAVISEESMIPLCEKYGVEWCMHENLPLGRKKNYGITQALKKDWDYLMEIGSDDLIKDDVFNLYTWDYDMMSLGDACLIDSVTGRCKKLIGRVNFFGAGRVMKRNVIESFVENGECKFWGDKLNSGLDKNTLFKIVPKGFSSKVFSSEKPLVTAIKSDVNIWSYRVVRGKPYEIDEALEGLSEEEKNAINALVNVAV